ncbi:anthranilate synthase component II [Neptunicella marina]|uniref:Aminodeoxychorismate/anthranilate synthase component II n=1 Tax=Neptunicella marina TaxID=2125989 RepID=A0A8J6IUH7_9ALTE|nr:aminodeoxychorismate/anthranilate synthase component II [Neptunicella marina]MBC3767605.1 aminodeoxychorismate/anthranilate synthase component II [Neptunicella marina]
MLLLIDNYDSFSHNLSRYFRELGQDVRVIRNDECDLNEIERLAPDFLVISPGPCTPNEAGISLQAIRYFAGKIPILGVCLGHQAIGQVFGASVVRADKVRHGKTSELIVSGDKLFKDLSTPFVATRYHSLVLKEQSISDEFIISARSTYPDGSIEAVMAIEHKTLPICGVQFHPESVMTEQGHQVLRNFLHYYALNTSAA